MRVCRSDCRRGVGRSTQIAVSTAAAGPTAKRTALSVGGTIERVFRGKTIKLTVTKDGFRIGKTTYRSLTAAAKAVTKYPSISGPSFFGTDEASKKGGTA